jgi:GTPase
MENKSFKSGYIGLVGRTNVGKSTLINKIFDRNIVITSDKAQTTRSRINCIYNIDNAQAVFVDCPGFFKPRNLLGEKLNRIIFQVLDDVDIIVAMVDFPDGIGVGDYYVFEQIKSRHVPKILILNKIDLLNAQGKYSLLETISKIRNELDFFEEIIPVSASTGENLEELLKVLMGKLPVGPMYYPGGMVTDMPLNKMVSEIIREKLSANLFDELPHSINVEVVSLQRKGAGKGNGAGEGKGAGIENAAGPGKGFGMQEDAFMPQETDMALWGVLKEAAGIKKVAVQGEAAGLEAGSGMKEWAGAGSVAKDGSDRELVIIECNIYVEKKSHKSMIIGKSGSMLKKIGGLSRIEIEKLLDSRVFLKLWVKVEENWTRKEAYMDRFGY